MILTRHRLLGFLAIIVSMIGSAAWAVRAQASVPNTWTTVAPPPEGRMWPAVASADGRLYVFGRFCSTGVCKTFDAYNPKTNTWAAVGTVPEALRGILSATTGPDGRIYIYGLATLLVYDPRANAWTHDAPPPGVEDSALLVTGRDVRI